jgi:O-antigen ligase
MSFFDRAAKYTLLFIGFSIPISTVLVNVGVGFLLLCFLLSRPSHLSWRSTWHAKWITISRNPIALLTVLLFLLLGIGTVYSTANFHDAVNVWMKYRKLLCILILIPFLQEAQWRRWALGAFLAALLVTLFLSYAGVIRELILHVPLTNAVVFKSHIAQNLLMAFTAYLLLLISLDTATRPIWRWLAALGTLLAICNVLIFVQGRIGYIVLIVLLMFAAWQQFGLRGLAIGSLLVGILFAIVFFLSNTFQYRVLHTFQEVQRYQSTNELTSAGTRLEFYKTTLQMIQKNPLFGQGTGALTQTKVSYLNMPNPHNEYLMLAVQIGLIGLSVFLYLLFQLWKQSWELPPFERKIAQGTIVAFMIGCIFNSLLLDFTEGYWFIYFVAVLYAGSRNSIRHWFPRQRPRGMTTSH